MNKYVQCKLKNGEREDIAWIPIEYAVVGRTLQLKKDKNIGWEDGWLVVEKFFTLSEASLKERNRDYRRMSTFSPK